MSLTRVSSVLMIALAVSACGKKSNSLDIAGLNTQGSARASGSGSLGLKEVLCQSPFALEIDGLTPLSKRADIIAALGSDRYEITEMQTNMIWPDNNSFTIETSKTASFEAKLLCNGTENPGHGNDRELKASFKASSKIDGSVTRNNSDQRVLRAAFNTGAVVTLQSFLEPSRSASTIVDRDLPTGRIRTGNDNFITIRLYQTVDKSTGKKILELRMIFEGPAEENGKRALQTSRVVYEQI